VKRTKNVDRLSQRSTTEKEGENFWKSTTPVYTRTSYHKKEGPRKSQNAMTQKPHEKTIVLVRSQFSMRLPGRQVEGNKGRVGKGSRKRFKKPTRENLTLGQLEPGEKRPPGKWNLGVKATNKRNKRRRRPKTERECLTSISRLAWETVTWSFRSVLIREKEEKKRDSGEF